MANTANTFTSLQPLFKEVYADGKPIKGLNYKKYGSRKKKFSKLKDYLRGK